MKNQTSISEMEHFHFGRKVICTDGEEGILACVGFDDGEQRLISVGIKLGRLFGKVVYLPFSAIIDASGNGVEVNVTRAELAASTSPLVGLVLDSKSVVVNSDTSSRGTLKSIAVHPGTGAFAYLVARHLRPGKDILVTAQYLVRLEPAQAVVSIPDAIFQALPTYRSDEELQAEVEAILYSYAPLHVDMEAITISVLDAVLYVQGNISSSLRSDILEDQVAGVPGLLEVKNLLVGDDVLAADLAYALSHDPRTSDTSIGIYPRLGAVRLSGFVRNNQQKSSAESIARSFPGVCSVDNDLIVDAKHAGLNVMAPAISGNLEDRVPGEYVRHTK